MYDSKPKMKRGAKVLACVIGLVVALPILFYCGGFALLVGSSVFNDLVNSGSTSGATAVERAAKILGNVNGGNWRSAASNARAEWTAPDFHGDNAEYCAFDLPVDEVQAFEEGIKAAWSKDVNFRAPNRIKSMPSANNEPDWWIHERLQDGVYYQRGVDTIGISPKTGRVMLRRWMS